MLNIPSTVSIFLHTRPTDMRKGFDGLSGIVREAFGADPLDGSLFLFVNRRRDRLKMRPRPSGGRPSCRAGGRVGRSVYRDRRDAVGDALGRRVVGVGREASQALSPGVLSEWIEKPNPFSTFFRNSSPWALRDCWQLL